MVVGGRTWGPPSGDAGAMDARVNTEDVGVRDDEVSLLMGHGPSAGGGVRVDHGGGGGKWILSLPARPVSGRR